MMDRHQDATSRRHLKLSELIQLLVRTMLSMNAIKRNAAGKLPRMVKEFLLATTLEMS